jgi:hypothetical protein
MVTNVVRLLTNGRSLVSIDEFRLPRRLTATLDPRADTCATLRFANGYGGASMRELGGG